MADRPAVPGSCPICGTRLEVQRLHCPHCGTALEGRFALCSFCSLTLEQRQFAELFIVARGNLREMERMLGMSYPAVRARLESVIEALGYAAGRATGDTAMREASSQEPVAPGTASVASSPRGAGQARTGPAAPAAQASGAGQVSAAERRAILEALERGEISPEEALQRLRGGGPGHKR